MDFLSYRFEIFSCIFFTLLLYFIQKQRELINKIKYSEERFRHIADGSCDWIWETDKSGKYIYCSHGIKDLLGYEVSEAIGKMYFYDFCFPEDKEKLKREAERMAKNKQHLVNETGRRRHKDGHEVILDIRGFSRLDKEGNIIGYRGVDRDVTEAKKREDRMRELAKFPSESLNQILRVSKEGNILFANSASKPLLDSWKVGIDQKAPEQWIEVVRDSIEHLKAKEVDWSIGDETFSLHITPVMRENYVDIYGVNVTDRRKIEQELEESRESLEVANQDLRENESLLRTMLKDMDMANRQLREAQDELIQTQKMAAIGSLSSGIAHEVRNPLAIILQSVERLEKIIDAQGQVDGEHVETIKKSVVRANKIVNTLLTFSRSTHIRLKPLDFHNVINEAIFLISNELSNKQINVRREFCQDMPLVSGDSIALEQVFFVLFENAIDAMPEGGEIAIATKTEKSTQEFDGKPAVIVEVKDTGRGISSKNLQTIFDPFFTTKDPEKGTGLGLSTVYLILKRHNGRIDVESIEGKGAVFKVMLPLQETGEK